MWIKYILILNILLLVISQLATITHELGHALPALIFTKDNVKITLGKRNKKTKQFNLGKINIEFMGFSPFTGFIYCNSNKLNKIQNIIISIGGPVVSLIIGIILLIISRNISYSFLKQSAVFSAYYHIYQFIITIIPIVYPRWWYGYSGCPSDGYRILKLIKLEGDING